MPSIIETNALKAASRFSSGVPPGGASNSLSQGQRTTATWANWVTNFINNMRVIGGSLSYTGEVATLTIFKQNLFGQCTRNATTASTLDVSELWGMDSGGGAWDQVSTGAGSGTNNVDAITGFTSGTYWAYVNATDAGVFSMAKTTAGAAKPPPDATNEIFILAEVIASGSKITTINQWWHGGAGMYSTRV